VIAARWSFAVLTSLTACRSSTPPAQTSVAATRPIEEPYVSNLTGVAFGNAFVRATADGAPSTDTKSSTADQAVSSTASKEGDEIKRSCGNQGARSHAQATATFQPASVVGVRQFGFTLSTTAYAKGGSWSERFVICRGSHTTVAMADARVTGRLNLTFNPGENTSDQLILRVSGASPEVARLEVRDGQNQLLPLSAVAGETWVTTTIAKPGPYSVHASITSHAEHIGAENKHGQHETTFSVSVQSMRDALALGYGKELTTARTLPVPVFVSADAMSAALDSAVFTDQHRLFPCAKIDCGTDRLRDVYVETPRVSTNGGAVVLDMDLSGSYQVALIFGGGISGTIRVTAVPVVEHDTLRFETPSVDVATHNLLVKWRSAKFEQMLLDRINKVRIDLTPQLRAAVEKAQGNFSGALGGACVLLTPTRAHVRSVQVMTTAPQGIVAGFDIELSEATGNACDKRKTVR
jgi:hypothetical protein